MGRIKYDALLLALFKRPPFSFNLFSHSLLTSGQLTLPQFLNMASSHSFSSSMEAALSSSNRVSRFSETPPLFQSIKPSNKRTTCYPKISFIPPSTSSFGSGGGCCSPRLVVSRAELSGESGCEEEDITGLKNDNGGLVPESTFSLSQVKPLVFLLLIIYLIIIES